MKALLHFDGLVQERRNSSALAMELRLSCINPMIYESVDNLVSTCKKVKIKYYFIPKLSPEKKGICTQCDYNLKCIFIKALINDINSLKPSDDRMAWILVNSGSPNGLFRDGTQSITFTHFGIVSPVETCPLSCPL